MIAASIWVWVSFVGFVLAMLALDLGVFNRTPHVVSAKEAGAWTAVWVGLALLFATGLAMFVGSNTALNFLTGYVIEESLSLGNIFVIVLIFQFFRVPAQYHHRVLFWGILGALVMRGLLIAVGAALLARFWWMTYVFGSLLVVAGVQTAVKRDEKFDGNQNVLVKFVRRHLPITDDYRGKHFFSLEQGRRHATPLLLALVLVEATGLIFAIESIPAVFGIARDPFIVFTSNIFAVMGLRSLFFLLPDLVQKFHLLKYGVAVILAFVGDKMMFEVWLPINVLVSLAIVLGVLAISIIASLIWPLAQQPSEGSTGSMFGR